jgi:adenylate cyclase
MANRTPPRRSSARRRPASGAAKKAPSTPSSSSSSSSRMKNGKVRAALQLFRQLYSAARLKQWHLTMYGWIKWKNFYDYDGMKRAFDVMAQRERIASINTAIANEAKELLGINDARFFLLDSASGLLFAQAHPEDEPLVTTIRADLGMVVHVARTRNAVRMWLNPRPDSDSAPRYLFSDGLREDEIFDQNIDVDSKLGIEGTRNALAVPILGGDGDDADRPIIGVCQIINKFSGNFGDDDVNTLKDFTEFVRHNVLEQKSQGDVAGLLKAAEKWKLDRRIAAMNDALYYQHLGVYMREARELVSADRSTLFLVDRDGAVPMLWAKVIEGMAPIRLPFGAGVVGSAAELARVVNIPDAYKDARFSPAFDKKSGYHTRSILCAPVFRKIVGDRGDGGSGGDKSEPELIGVMQCINSLNGVFTDDEAGMLAEICSKISDQVLREDVPVNEMQAMQSKLNHWKRQRKRRAETMTK